MLKKCALINFAIIVGAITTTMSIMPNDANAYENKCKCTDTYCDCYSLTLKMDGLILGTKLYPTYLRKKEIFYLMNLMNYMRV